MIRFSTDQEQLEPLVCLPRPSLQYQEQEYVSALKIRLKAYVLDAKYEKALSTDIMLRVLEAF